MDNANNNSAEQGAPKPGCRFCKHKWVKVILAILIILAVFAAGAAVGIRKGCFERGGKGWGMQFGPGWGVSGQQQGFQMMGAPGGNVFYKSANGPAGEISGTAGLDGNWSAPAANDNGANPSDVSGDDNSNSAEADQSAALTSYKVFGRIAKIEGGVITIDDNGAGQTQVLSQVDTDIESTGGAIGLSALKVGQNIQVTGDFDEQDRLVAYEIDVVK